MFGNSLYYWNQNVLVRHSETLKREYRQLMIDYPGGLRRDQSGRCQTVRHSRRQADAALRRCRVGGGHGSNHFRSQDRNHFRPHFMREVEQQILGSLWRHFAAGSGSRGEGGGMKARILYRNDVLKIVDLLRQQGYEVIAPFRGRGRDTFFDPVTDQNRDQIQIHLPNPYYPPKRYVFPPIERLLKVERSNGDLRIVPTYDVPKRAIFGIRSCDVAGIYHLDRFTWAANFPTSTIRTIATTCSS